MSPKRKGKVSKTSASKLANKRQYKLGKQGKLTKLANKEKRRQKLSLRGDNPRTTTTKEEKRSSDEEQLLPLDEDDVNYFQTPEHAGFASTVQKRGVDTKLPFKKMPTKAKDVTTEEDGNVKKRKRKIEEEEDYERLPRKQFDADKKMRMILPIKTKGGIVRRMVEEEEEEESSPEEEEAAPKSPDPVAEQQEPEKLPALSSVELYVRRQEKLMERKRKMAALSHSVLENPEENMKRLKDLVAMLHERDPDVFMTVRKLVMVSLVEVFKDIVPGYRIRLPSDKEKQQRMKKETIVVLAHEDALLKSYKNYLEFLEKTAKGKLEEEGKGKYHKNRDEIPMTEAGKQGLSLVAVKCLCEMLTSHPEFNYRNNVITVIVPYMNHRNQQISDTACHAIRQVFKEDRAGEITLEIVRCVSKMIKVREFRVQPKVLECFLSLKIKEVSYTDPLTMKEEKNKDDKNQKLSRRDRKRRKHMLLLERELKETKATEDKKKRLKLHTETIQAVFLTYFRILKQATNSQLLAPVLEGLAKFAHLINTDFFNDLFTVFKELIESGDLSYRESLHCVQTAFTILSGQGSALNIDPTDFYRHLYRTLFHLHAGSTCDDVPIVLDCLDIMVNKRRKQMSQQRVLSFVKRLSSLTLQQQPSGALGLLAAVRTFLQTYSYSNVLFDNEAQGSGVFLPELEDPEHCNAHNTALWETSYLRHHYHPTVRKYGSHICHGAPITGEGQLPQELRKPALQLYRVTDAETAQLFHSSIPATTTKTRKVKRKHNGFVQPGMTEEVLDKLSTTPDTLMNMNRKSKSQMCTDSNGLHVS